jgi:hypothetical protein
MLYFPKLIFILFAREKPRKILPLFREKGGLFYLMLTRERGRVKVGRERNYDGVAARKNQREKEGKRMLSSPLMGAYDRSPLRSGASAAAVAA